MIKKRSPVIDIFFTLPVIAFIFLFPHSGLIPFPFAYIVPVLLVVWLFLKRTQEDFSSLGFRLKNFEPKAIFIGTLTAILLFVFLQYLFFPLLRKIITLEKANLADFTGLRYNLPLYLFMLLMSWLAGGFYEELVFHGFIFTRLERLLPGKYAIGSGFILTNLIFGLYHYQLGTSGTLNAFLAGSAYHALMINITEICGMPFSVMLFLIPSH